MTRYIYLLGFLALFLIAPTSTEAGNPDRQGEAGAAQLLLNPWARSAGLHSMNTANISGVEAMRLNVAGLSRAKGTEIVVSHARYFDGADIGLNAVGLAQRVGKNGTFGVSLMAVDLGDINVTTDDQPEGTGATFSPSIFNLGVGYAHMFENKVSVGVTFRMVSEGNTDVNAFGMAIDAGVQYVTGPQDNFKFGISLRNIGSPMKFKGEGLSETAPNPNDQTYPLTYFRRAQKFELPSTLNIGASYDFLVNAKNRVTVVGNFTSNSFSQDQVGGGIEYAFNEILMLRGGYKYEFRTGNSEEDPIYTGVSAGVSVDVPLKRDGDGARFGIDYAYRHTKILNGTHNISVRITL